MKNTETRVKQKNGLQNWKKLRKKTKQKRHKNLETTKKKQTRTKSNQHEKEGEDVKYLRQIMITTKRKLYDRRYMWKRVQALRFYSNARGRPFKGTQTKWKVTKQTPSAYDKKNQQQQQLLLYEIYMNFACKNYYY